MKRILSLILTVFLLAGMVPAMAAEEPVWKIHPSLGIVKLTNSTRVEGAIAIPEEVEGVSVRGLEYMCFMPNRDITSITIPDTVYFFDRGITSSLENLEELKLPRDLIVMLAGCIGDMPKLESLTVPPSVSLIQGSFYNLAGLKSITFEGVCPVFAPDTYYTTFSNLPDDCVIYVPDDQADAYKAAFEGREDVLARIRPSGKKAVVIDWTAPESDFVFDAATGTITGYKGSAGRMEIPASIGGTPVRHIGKSAFQQCYSLCFVTIPEGVETVEKNAFQGNTLMSYVSLPSTLHTLSDGAFSSNNLATVRWSEGLEHVGNKVFYNSDIDYAVLPTTLRTIGTSGFERAGFKYLTFGPNVETVGEKGFAGNDFAALTYTGSAMPRFGADAFKDNKKEATLTLADGVPMKLFEDFSEYMADAYPVCTVIEPQNAVLPFPELDVMAGMPFFGVWNGVAANDGTNIYGMDLLDMSISCTLMPDGTGSLSMEGETNEGAWYMDNGNAVFAPVLEEGGKPSQADAVPFVLDENGRMTIDFGGIILILEQEGKTYAVPAIPEKPWPELDPAYAADYVGVWEAVEYIVDGETYDAELVGAMTVTLNDDGTAAVVENGYDEVYSDMRWYADSGCAYIGFTADALFGIIPGENGTVCLEQDGSTVILARPGKEVVIEGADELLGEWKDDIGVVLTIAKDGTLTAAYPDGYVRDMKWNVVDGEAVVTEGTWAGCPITLENGIVTISNGEGIYQIFSIDGDLSAVYGTDEEEAEGGEISDEELMMLLAMLAAMEEEAEEPEADPYIGAKFEMKGAVMQGIQLTAEQLGCAGDYVVFNPDGSAELVIGGISIPTLGWKRGTVNVLGTEYDGFTIDYYGTSYNFAAAENGLLMDYYGMLRTYEKAEDEAAPGEDGADPYVDRKFLCTGSVIQGMRMTAEQLGCAGDYVVFKSDGSAELVMSGIPVQNLGWKRGTVNVLGTEYDGFAIDYYGTIYNFAISEDGLLMDYFGMLRTYEAE